jgi:hypothetical protein
MAAVPLAEGVDDGLFVNGPYDHDPCWPVVQRTHTHLERVEYDQVPRGRVLFNKIESRFYGYLDKVLDTPMMKRMIMARFHLPRKHTVFQTALHYTTDPGDLNQLSLDYVQEFCSPLSVARLCHDWASPQRDEIPCHDICHPRLPHPQKMQCSSSVNAQQRTCGRMIIEPNAFTGARSIGAPLTVTTAAKRVDGSPG